MDAAMNDLIRPALYRAHHDIIPVRKNSLPPVTADVVGPICETGDFLARDREMANVMPGRFRGGVRGRGVRIRAVVELQFAAARPGGAGGRGGVPCDPAAGDVRRSRPRRDGVGQDKPRRDCAGTEMTILVAARPQPPVVYRYSHGIRTTFPQGDAGGRGGIAGASGGG